MKLPEIDVTIASPLWDQKEYNFNPQTLPLEIIPLVWQQADLPNLLDERNIEMSLVLTDDAQIRDLNRQYRGKDKATNVLSFSTLNAQDVLPPEGPCHIGDIIIAFETLEREAQTMGVPLRHHFIHLLIHGTLHLLGYDHEEEEDAEIMEELEIIILDQLGIENPYENSKFVA